jgi:hypothetical protein
MNSGFNNGCCRLLTVVFSFIFAILAGIASLFGLITATETVVLFMLSITVLFLLALFAGLLTLIVNPRGSLISCINNLICFLLFGIIGTIIIGIILLAVSPVCSIFGSILFALVTLFFVLAFGGFICLILCFSNKLFNRSCEER